METNKGGRPIDPAKHADSAALRNAISDLVIEGAVAGEPSLRQVVQIVVKALKREEQQ